MQPSTPSAIRKCAIALILAAQAGAAFALATENPASPIATPASEPLPEVTGEAGQRCDVFSPRSHRPIAQSMRTLEKACRKLDRLPITDAEARIIYQQMLVQAGGDAAGQY